MRQTIITRCLVTGIFSMLLVSRFVLAGHTGSHPDLTGRWVAQAELCHLLCAFTLTNEGGDNHGKMVLKFDKGTWSEDASGTFLHVKGNEYALSDGENDIPFELREGTLVILGGTVFKRDTLHSH